VKFPKIFIFRENYNNFQVFGYHPGIMKTSSSGVGSQ
jgi:hypothetical protein